MVNTELFFLSIGDMVLKISSEIFSSFRFPLIPSYSLHRLLLQSFNQSPEIKLSTFLLKLVCEIPRIFERASPSNFRTQGSFIHIIGFSETETTCHKFPLKLISVLKKTIKAFLCSHIFSLRWSETKNLKILIIDNLFSCHLMVMKLCTVIELGIT